MDPTPGSSSQLISAAAAFGYWVGSKHIVERPQDLIQELGTHSKGALLCASEHLFNPPSENTLSTSVKALHTPVDDLWRELASNLRISPRPFWPNAAPYAVCFTHDIDRIRRTYQHAFRVFRKQGVNAGLTALWRDLRRVDNPYYNFSRLREFMDSHRIRSAFYVLFERMRPLKALLEKAPQHVLGVYQPEEIAEELRSLHAVGFEIGLHGSFDAITSASRVCEEMGKLGDLLRLGSVGLGIRNHYLQFKFGKSESILEQSGALYDSTLGFNFTNGFRCGTAFPFPLVARGLSSILELPLTVMDTALRFDSSIMQRPLCDLANSVVERVRSAGGLLMINWHQHFCSYEAFPDMYDWISAVVEDIHRDHAYVATPSEINAHWKSRVV